jgi:hypothetical protein
MYTDRYWIEINNSRKKQIQQWSQWLNMPIETQGNIFEDYHWKFIVIYAM